MDAYGVMLMLTTYLLICSIFLALTLFLLSYAFRIAIHKAKEEINKVNTYESEVTANVLQSIACDYNVRAIKCGYGEISLKLESLDNDDIRVVKSDDPIRWKSIEIGKEMIPNDTDHFSNIEVDIYFYSGNKKHSSKTVYIIRYRLFGNYYVAYGRNPLIAWSVVIRNARLLNRIMFSNYRK